MVRPALRAALAVALSAACAMPALAEDDPADCSFVAYDSAVPIQIARVKPGVAKLHFIKSKAETATCPSTGPACEARAYLQAGDVAIAGKALPGFACAQYLSAKGRTTAGWLPTSGIDLLAPRQASKPTDWTGKWLRDEASITIKALKGGKLDVNGEAVANSHDPEIVRRGNVRSGDIQATTAPVDGHLEFGAGDDVAFDRDDREQNCQMKLWRVESLLLVEDTGNCGGYGVSFTGIYTLAK
eukprot:gene27300-30148_t